MSPPGRDVGAPGLDHRRLAFAVQRRGHSVCWLPRGQALHQRLGHPEKLLPPPPRRRTPGRLSITSNKGAVGTAGWENRRGVRINRSSSYSSRLAFVLRRVTGCALVVVIFIKKMFGGYDLEEFPYATMSSFESGKGILGHTAKFMGSGNSTRITMMNTGDS
jgi:hypothetical protein